MSKESILSAFKKQLVSFIDELIEQFPRCPDFIVMRIFINDQISIKSIIKKFIKDILPLTDLIKNRDDNFFLKTQIVPYPQNPNFFKDLCKEGCFHVDYLNGAKIMLSSIRKTHRIFSQYIASDLMYTAFIKNKN